MHRFHVVRHVARLRCVFDCVTEQDSPPHLVVENQCLFACSSVYITNCALLMGTGRVWFWLQGG